MTGFLFLNSFICYILLCNISRKRSCYVLRLKFVTLCVMLFLHFVQKDVLKCLMSLHFALILSIIIFCGVTDTERPKVDQI